MTCTALVLTLSALLPADAPASKSPPRERHPLAPSLPLLTKEEQEKVKKIIDRFIDYDTGKLRGAEGARALKDFQGLGLAAIPCLIEGLNRAANLEHSCPAVIIARKLAGFLVASNDQELLQFARENIGAGVTAKRHQAVIQDLRVLCMVRNGTLQRRALAAGATGKTLRSHTTAELITAAGSERGPRLKAILAELETRKGDDVINALGVAAASYEEDICKLGQKLLLRHLSRLDGPALKERLKDDRAAVRAAAAQTIGGKKLRYGAELIACLSDVDNEVRQAARKALVRLADGVDHGPEPNTSASELVEAIRRWEAWWARQTTK
jgi:hypothetical protein